MGDAPAHPHASPVRQGQTRTEQTDLQDAPASDVLDPVLDGTFAGGEPGVSGYIALLRHAGERARPALVARLQRRYGNRVVQRMLAELAAPAQPRAPAGPLTTIQRQPQAGTAAPPAPGTTPEAKPTFTEPLFVFIGPNFDATYVPVAPLPATGTLEITLRIHVTFQDFTRDIRQQEPYRSMRFTRAQRQDFTWKDSEKQRFTRDFQESVRSVWSERHRFRLRDPSFAEYIARVRVNVEVAAAPDEAHFRVTALKIPRGAPRFRSFVDQEARTATLDIRDPSESEHFRFRPRHFARQIGPFDQDSAALNSAVETQIGAAEASLHSQNIPDPDRGEWIVRFTGRASSPGPVEHNRAIARQRAQSVRQRLVSDMGWAAPRVRTTIRAEGERFATEDLSWRRVEIEVMEARPREVEQNVAAHEVGHMFGLDDEYVEEAAEGGDVAPKFAGQQPEHYQKVRDLMGDAAADELLTQNSASLLSMGGEVRRGHYVYFLDALNQMTGKSWSVE